MLVFYVLARKRTTQIMTVHLRSSVLFFTPPALLSKRSERWVYDISVRSMDIDDRPATDDRPQGPFTYFGKFRMAISKRRVIRSTSCLVLVWGFRGRRIERRHFRLHQIQDGGLRPFWKKSNAHNGTSFWCLLRFKMNGRAMRQACRRRELKCWRDESSPPDLRCI